MSETAVAVEEPGAVAPVEEAFVPPVAQSPLPKSAPPAPRQVPGSGKFIMHFMVPVAKAPAPHMISGEPPALREFAEAVKAPFGHQGQAYAPACNPKQVTGEFHRASGAPWALISLVNNEPTIDPSACRACMATEAWKAAYAENPHPQIKPEEQVSGRGCC